MAKVGRPKWDHRSINIGEVPRVVGFGKGDSASTATLRCSTTLRLGPSLTVKDLRRINGYYVVGKLSTSERIVGAGEEEKMRMEPGLFNLNLDVYVTAIPPEMKHG